MASIREYYENLGNTISETKDLLADKLIQFHIIDEEDRGLSFYDMLQLVNPEDFNYIGTLKTVTIPTEDPSIPHFSDSNEILNFLYTNNTSKILTYEMTLEELNYIIAKKSLYYKNYLKARLEQMGVNLRLINDATTIKALIQLLNYISRRKYTNIEFVPDETLYYNIDRLLNVQVYDDTGSKVTEGRIEVYIDGVFLIQYYATDEYYYKPQELGQHTIRLKYIGTRKFVSSVTSTYTFNVIDGFLKIDAQIKNTNKKSPYYNKIIYDENNEPIYQGCKDDTWDIDIKITDGKDENILENIPFSIRLMTYNITDDVYITGIKQLKNILLPRDNNYYSTNNNVPEYICLYIETYLNNENYIEASKIIKVRILYPPIYIDNNFLTQYKGDNHYLRTPVYLQNIYDGTPIEDTNYKSITITRENDTFTDYYNTCMYYLEPFDELEYGITPFTITICKDTPSYMYQKINWENITQLSFSYRSAGYGVLDIYIGEEKIGTVNPSENWTTFTYNDVQSLFTGQIYIQELRFENKFSDKYIFIDDITVDKENAIVNNDFEMGLHAWTRSGDIQRSSQGQNGYCAIIKNNKECYTAKLEFNILSNFIIPEKNIFYLPHVPQIYYKPRGEIDTSATVDLTLNNNLTQITSTNTGLLTEVSNLSNVGEYDIELLTSSNLLEEEIDLHYFIEEPFSIEEIGSESDIIYQITIYPTYNSCTITVVNENHGTIQTSQTVTTTDTETVYDIIIPKTNNTMGENTLTINLDGYIKNQTFYIVSDLLLLTDMQLLNNGNIRYTSTERNDIDNTKIVNSLNFDQGIITLDKHLIEHYYDIIDDSVIGNMRINNQKNIVYEQYSGDNVNKVLTLTTDKENLSAAHEETATIIATYTEDDIGKSGQTITFSQGNNTLATRTTDNNGITTYTYTAVGDNEITITATTNGATDTVTFNDYLLYDDGSTDKSDIYSIHFQSTTVNNVSLIHDDTNQRYEFIVPSAKDKFSIIRFGNGFIENDIYCEMDIYMVNSSTPYNLLMNLRDIYTYADGYHENGIQVGRWTSQRVLRAFKNASKLGDYAPNGALSTSIWYRLSAYMDNTNSNLAGKILNLNDNSNLEKTWTNNLTPSDKWYLTLGMYGTSSPNRVYIKNVIVKKI